MRVLLPAAITTATGSAFPDKLIGPPCVHVLSIVTEAQTKTSGPAGEGAVSPPVAAREGGRIEPTRWADAQRLLAARLYEESEIRPRSDLMGWFSRRALAGKRALVTGASSGI